MRFPLTTGDDLGETLTAQQLLRDGDVMVEGMGDMMT